MILIGNGIADKITRFSKILRQNSSETSTNEIENIDSDKKIRKERYIFPEQTQTITDDLRLI